MKTSIRLLSLVAAALLLAACAAAPQVATQPVELMLPTEPPLPAIRGTAFDCPADVAKAHPGLSCISQATYAQLVQRERALRRWADQMQAVIYANNVCAAELKEHIPAAKDTCGRH